MREEWGNATGTALQPVESPHWSRLLVGGMICGGPLLLHSVPEGFYPVGRAHIGTVCEGLSYGRGLMLEQEKIVRRGKQPRAAVMH